MENETSQNVKLFEECFAISDHYITGLQNVQVGEWADLTQLGRTFGHWNIDLLLGLPFRHFALQLWPMRRRMQVGLHQM